MPWKSNQQRKWGNSSAGLKALGGESKVDEWNQASKGLKLPMAAPKKAKTYKMAKKKAIKI